MTPAELDQIIKNAETAQAEVRKRVDTLNDYKLLGEWSAELAEIAKRYQVLTELITEKNAQLTK